MFEDIFLSTFQTPMHASKHSSKVFYDETEFLDHQINYGLISIWLQVMLFSVVISFKSP